MAPQPGPPQILAPLARTRRALLGTLLGVATFTVAALTARLRWRRRRRGPQERELSEANLYGPHDLAG